MDRKDILAIYNAGPEAVIDLIERLIERIKVLEDRLAKDSHNSSKPPSSDIIRDRLPNSLRKPNGRKPGGQNGHNGNTLKMADNPDRVTNHPVDRCENCSRSLKDTEPNGYERRQVFDIPPLKIEVEEHRYEIKDCPYCKHKNKADISKETPEYIQYGDRIKSLIVYLMEYHLIPYERTTEIIRDIFGQNISEGTLYKTNKKCYKYLGVFEEEIKRQLIRSNVVNFDETGFYCNGSRNWLHSASTPELTFYAHHPKRGREAIDEIGILPQFEGTAVHDYWMPYLDYPCFHALCNGHLLRELTFVHEQHGEKWADRMIELLIEIKKKIEETKPYRNKLRRKIIAVFEARYNKIIQAGLRVHGPPVPLENSHKRRGRKKQSIGKNLLDRFKKHRQEILAFMYNFLVPFDNNLVERDIRMLKVQQKISGCFRSKEGADFFCRIRGYISTVKKHNLKVMEAIQDVFAEHPFIPQFSG